MSLKHGQARWAFDLSAWKPTLSELTLATACIQPEEKTRLAKFVFREDFNASLIGRLLMRAFVKKCVPTIDYNQIKFIRDARGKPHLQQDTNFDKWMLNGRKIHLDFNVSHHESYVVLAGCISNRINESISGNLASNTNDNKLPTIGVDVMKMEYTGGKSLKEFFRIMDRNFTADEWQFIKSRRDDFGQTEAFMRNWCLKEAYVKNIGVGILSNLRRVNFSIQTECLSREHIVVDTKVTADGETCDNWLFEESLLDDKHCVAVSLQNPTDIYLLSEKTFFERLDFTMLMEHAIPLEEEDISYCQDIMAKEYKKA